MYSLVRVSFSFNNDDGAKSSALWFVVSLFHQMKLFRPKRTRGACKTGRQTGRDGVGKNGVTSRLGRCGRSVASMGWLCTACASSCGKWSLLVAYKVARNMIERCQLERVCCSVKWRERRRESEECALCVVLIDVEKQAVELWSKSNQYHVWRERVWPGKQFSSSGAHRGLKTGNNCSTGLKCCGFQNLTHVRVLSEPK